jgi:hypothetical protein
MLHSASHFCKIGFMAEGFQDRPLYPVLPNHGDKSELNKLIKFAQFSSQCDNMCLVINAHSKYFAIIGIAK